MLWESTAGDVGLLSVREAGARVREIVELREMGVAGVDPSTRRKIEVVAAGLPFAFGGIVRVQGSPKQQGVQAPRRKYSLSRAEVQVHIPEIQGSKGRTKA